MFDANDEKNYTIIYSTALFSLATVMKNQYPYSVFKDHKVFHHIMYFGIFIDMNKKVEGSMFLWNSENNRFICVDVFTVIMQINKESSLRIWLNEGTGQAEFFDCRLQPNYVYYVNKGGIFGIN